VKVLFLEDTIPIKEMFAPIVDRLENIGIICKKVGYDIKVNELLDKEKPDLVVLAREETNQIEHEFAVSNTPTLLIPHGLLMPNEKELWKVNGSLRIGHTIRLFRQFKHKVKKKKISLYKLITIGLFRLFNDFKDGKTLSKYNDFTKIASYGINMRDILLRYKVRGNNIVITGNPKYDKYLNVCHEKSGRVLLITDYLVEFGLWSEKQRLNYIKDVSEVVHSITGNKLEILIHPVLEDKDEYEKIVVENKLYANVYQLKIEQLINECDMTITLLSTSGIEVMAAEKPLIIYNPYRNPTLYYDENGCHVAYDKETLYSIIKHLIEDGMSDEKQTASQKFVYNQIYAQDGRATDRIVDVILKMGDNECLKINPS
jgi:hypothetical protein